MLNKLILFLIKYSSRFDEINHLNSFTFLGGIHRKVERHERIQAAKVRRLLKDLESLKAQRKYLVDFAKHRV